MAISIVQLGTARGRNEGLRIGTVRRPPRGIPKTEFASRDFYDTWLPALSPSPELMALGKAVTDEPSWNSFKLKFRKEMHLPDASKVLDLIAALSHQTHISIGCYCEDENRCHRSVLRELLKERCAAMA